MRSVPFINCDAIQINPNLGIILSQNMQGWYWERYINVFMNGSFFDYVDNVNYSGLIMCQRVYDFGEISTQGVPTIIETEIDKGNVLYIWVDEYHIEHSVRYGIDHFVHPIMVWGYDHKQQLLKTVFFDLLKGQVVLDMNYQALIAATTDLDKYYLNGGADETLTKTIMACRASDCHNGEFHLDVFASQLSNYLCCKNDFYAEWYTSRKTGISGSRMTIYGVQVYKQLIKLLSNKDTRKDIAFKTIHDFIAHKKNLSQRFDYIKNHYQTSSQYDLLIEEYTTICKRLEILRLLNMKLQVEQKMLPSTLCTQPDYIKKLVAVLNKCYYDELSLLPQIYEEVLKFSILRSPLLGDKHFRLFGCDAIQHVNCLEYSIDNDIGYVNGIDIIRCGEYPPSPQMQYVVLNNDFVIFLEKDGYGHLPVRSVRFSVQKINNIKMYGAENNNGIYYDMDLCVLESETNGESYSLLSNGEWTDNHHIKYLCENSPRLLSFQITGEDPYIVNDLVCIDADVFPWLHIRMKSDAPTIYAQVYFATMDNPNISAKQSLFFSIIPDGESHSYYINISEHQKWRGIVNIIRIDPAQFHDYYPWTNRTAFCEIEVIEFVNKKDELVKECMIAYDLLDDGTTFCHHDVDNKCCNAEL